MLDWLRVRDLALGYGYKLLLWLVKGGVIGS